MMYTHWLKLSPSCWKLCKIVQFGFGQLVVETYDGKRYDKVTEKQLRKL